uniref:LRAT domain-containing protein n=1 Tax=Fundulus heteroclitus TaxID=8078 RepID=A0A3Q2UE51_FUNHE
VIRMLYDHPGDLIEIFRSTYQHWAVYIGGGYVVHLVVDVQSKSHTLYLEFCKIVLKEKLEEVVGNDRWRINNYLDKKRKPQQVYAIVKQAIGLIGTRLQYNVATSNCEHFANDLRYGKPTSRQVGHKKLEVGAGVGGTLVGFVAVVGAVVGTVVGLSRR